MKERRPLLERFKDETGPYRLTREIGLVLGAYFVYMFIRKFLIPNIEAMSFENAVKVVDFEMAVGIFKEAAWQAWVLDNAKGVAIFMNWAYVLTFGPLIGASAVLFYVFDRKKYLYYRNVVFISFVLALLGFALYPLAPPRFIPEYGIIDSIRNLGPAWWVGHSWYGSRDTAVYFNVFAAMPSLHFGWTVMFGIMFLGTRSKLLKAFGVLYPTLTFFAIVLTGNHYMVDAFGGAAVAILSLSIHWALMKSRAHYQSSSVPIRRYPERVYASVSGYVLGLKAQPRRELASVETRGGDMKSTITLAWRRSKLKAKVDSFLGKRYNEVGNYRG